MSSIREVIEEIGYAANSLRAIKTIVVRNWKIPRFSNLARGARKFSLFS